MKITDKVFRELCRTLEEGTEASKKDLLKVVELIYEEWEYIKRGE